MNNDIITLSPVSIFEEIEGGINGLVCRPDDVYTDVGTLLQTLRDDFVLFSVIVAATARDQQGFEGLGGWRVGYKPRLTGFCWLCVNEERGK
jgi:hypothetical protein